MICLVRKLLSDAKIAPLLLAGISAAALGSALIGEYVFGLAPCELCLYQRVPYALVILFGLLGFAVAYKCKKGTATMLALSSLAFASNTVIAFYHTGVERHWWRSFLESCSVPNMPGNITDVLAAIETNTKAVPCDEIPWADPVLGLSMANYNVLACAVLALISALSALCIWRSIANGKSCPV